MRLSVDSQEGHNRQGHLRLCPSPLRQAAPYPAAGSPPCTGSGLSVRPPLLYPWPDFLSSSCPVHSHQNRNLMILQPHKWHVFRKK